MISWDTSADVWFAVEYFVSMHTEGIHVFRNKLTLKHVGDIRDWEDIAAEYVSAS